MVSIEHQFIFVHIPKTAGNAIQNVLRDFSEDTIICPALHQDGVERFEVQSFGIGTSKHAHLSEYKEKLSTEFFLKAYKFTCIRNPWDRMISFYFSPHRGVKDWVREDFLKFILEVPDSLGYLTLPESSEEDIFSNLDYFIRFEHLQNDFDRVCDAIGIGRCKLPVRNKANKKHYTCYYDNELVDIVGERFKSEINLFGYSYAAS